ncbi:hypothetical protein Her_0015 [Vibrio phage Her]|nr:hypothetical protein H20_0015 [Vibrio phage H20]ARB13241.1 hypothetical protein P3_0015 [Vibrio phage P3]ARH11578.1 hypothetical protein Her_0015 [Vibrio phage Her]ARH11609.1 hypothetical protein Pel_0015 [Vibrio phage Pel]ARH11639.1 hypothetical protein pVa2_0014 [Vibrio phage pVa-2]ARH11669.1 hypothetical protein pVa1_0015 [Vibrio phage pVa-1]ARH11701.1 hypothetical protein pVa5_0015 [Vibrio phage vB_VspP_pVa5_12Jun]ARH11731.1 hypothetical protein pVa6_0015 [Vibrio phage pVa-6]ARH11792
MIKFTCINAKHADIADIAKQQLELNGYKSCVLGRAVLSDCEWDEKAIEIMSNSIAYSETPTEFDANHLLRLK